MSSALFRSILHQLPSAFFKKIYDSHSTIFTIFMRLKTSCLLHNFNQFSTSYLVLILTIYDLHYFSYFDSDRLFFCTHVFEIIFVNRSGSLRIYIEISLQWTSRDQLKKSIITGLRLSVIHRLKSILRKKSI